MNGVETFRYRHLMQRAKALEAGGEREALLLVLPELQQLHDQHYETHIWYLEDKFGETWETRQHHEESEWLRRVKGR